MVAGVFVLFCFVLFTCYRFAVIQICFRCDHMDNRVSFILLCEKIPNGIVLVAFNQFSFSGDAESILFLSHHSDNTVTPIVFVSHVR